MSRTLRPGDPDPARPEDFPAVYRRVSCAACTICWLDTRRGRCDSGGPFTAAQFIRDPDSVESQTS